MGIENDSQTQEQRNDIKASRALGLRSVLEKPRMHTIHVNQGNGTRGPSTAWHLQNVKIQKTLIKTVECSSSLSGTTSIFHLTRPAQAGRNSLQQAVGKDSGVA